MSRRLDLPDQDEYRLLFASRLKMVRSVIEANQSEVARQVGVSPGVWYRYEVATREMPQIALARFCELYAVDPRWLLLGDLSALPGDISAVLARQYPEEIRRYLPKKFQPAQTGPEFPPRGPEWRPPSVVMPPGSGGPGRGPRRLVRSPC